MKEIESWKNGQWIPNSKIGAELWDAHYFFGWAVFEAIRTYKKIPHMLNCHIDRLYRSARLAEVPISIDKKEMIQLIHDVMDRNKQFFKGDEEYRMMIFASPGYFRIYDDMGKPEPLLTINTTTTSRYAKHIAPFLKKGFTAVISSQRQIPSRFLDPKIKSCSRLHYGLADAEAKRFGEGTVPILLDENGFIAESSGSNVGFIKDKSICLPREKNILRGCTMKFVEKLATDFEIPIIKDDWEVYDLLDANAIFFTSTFSGLTPAYEIIYRNKRHKLENGHKFIDELTTKFSWLVHIDVNKQWEDWYKR